MAKYDLFNELANVINTRIINKIDPGLGQNLHKHRIAYHKGLNAESLPEGYSDAFYKWGGTTKKVQDWGENVLNPLLGKVGTASLLASAGISPFAIYGAHKGAQVGSKFNTTDVSKRLTKTLEGIKALQNINKKPIGPGIIKNLQKINQGLYKTHPTKAAKTGAYTAAGAAIGVPLVFGGLMHGLRLLTTPLNWGLSKLGEWVHQYGSPYEKTPAKNIYQNTNPNKTNPRLTNQAYEYHKKHYYR